METGHRGGRAPLQPISHCDALTDVEVGAEMFSLQLCSHRQGSVRDKKSNHLHGAAGLRAAFPLTQMCLKPPRKVSCSQANRGSRPQPGVPVTLVKGAVTAAQCRAVAAVRHCAVLADFLLSRRLVSHDTTTTVTE